MKIFLLLIIAITASFNIGAEPPKMIFHSGKMLVDGRPITGKGYFKFAITNGHANCAIAAEGCVTSWSNNQSSNTGNEPVSSSAVDVIDGNYSIHLGDISRVNEGTSIRTEPIPASVFTNGSTFLHIWFSDNGKDRWQQLLPARQLVSVPYSYTELNAV